MRKLFYTITKEDRYKNIESYLMKRHGYSRHIVRALKTPQGVFKNGSFARMTEPIAAGDRLEITLPEQEKTEQKSSIAVPIVYEDDDLIVYNKPPFMATHPSKLHQQDSLSNVFFADMERQGLQVPFRAVYRLDRDTDGLILIAKNALSAAKLAGKIQKEYTGIIQGQLTPPEGIIDAPIAQLAPHKMERGVREDGQRAVTEYKTVLCANGYSLLTFRLHTGRTHQIRVHTAYMGHPLAGDSMYGGDSSLSRQALTCTSIEFTHPIRENCIKLRINIQDSLEQLVKNE